MPLVEGESSISTVWLILFSPKPATQALCSFSLPMGLLFKVTLIFFAAIYQPTISSSGIPRFSATLSGDRIFCSPLNVALITFTQLVDP